MKCFLAGTCLIAGILWMIFPGICCRPLFEAYTGFLLLSSSLVFTRDIVK